jgi:hypothetical protein
MVEEKFSEASFDRMVASNRPQAPAPLAGEFERIVQKARRPVFSAGWGLGLGLGFGMALLVFLPVQQAPVNLAERPAAVDIDNLLDEIALEMEEPSLEMEGAFDIYASL